jgi:DhnA family fructose-bisphosphate aldolase class Ia
MAEGAYYPRLFSSPRAVDCALCTEGILGLTATRRRAGRGEGTNILKISYPTRPSAEEYRVLIRYMP